MSLRPAAEVTMEVRVCTKECHRIIEQDRADTRADLIEKAKAAVMSINVDGLFRGKEIIIRAAALAAIDEILKEEKP